MELNSFYLLFDPLGNQVTCDEGDFGRVALAELDASFNPQHSPLL